MKKILLALCILLLAFPSWAASRVIQGDAQFVYSQEIDETVNPKIGEEQEFAGFGPEGEPIYTTIPIYKYTLLGLILKVNQYILLFRYINIRLLQAQR